MKYVPILLLAPYQQVGGLNLTNDASPSLAYAELYLTLAHLFRRFKLSVHETTDADMVWDDAFSILPRGHLKVLVQEVGG